MSTEHNRIYVASLSDYNAGLLHGVWIDFATCLNVDEVWGAINTMLSASPTAKREGFPAEEWAIHDYEGFGGIEVSENETIGTLWQAHELLSDLDDPEAFIDYLDYQGKATLSEVTESNIDAFQDAYHGWYRNKEDFAEELVEETGLLSHADDLLARYFDYEAFARDLFMSDYYMTENGYVFSSY